MKTKTVAIVLFYFSLAVIFSFNAISQETAAKKKVLTVLNIDSQGLTFTPVQLGNMVRLEIDKLDTFEVTDRYDVAYLLEKNKLNIANCYGKICLLETGKSINSDKILGGSIEAYNNAIFLTLKLIDVQTESVEKTYIREFLNIPEEIQNIIKVSVREMFNKPNPPELMTQLTKPYNYETVINNPNKERLNLSGPRMGAVGLFGHVGRIFTTDKVKGGFDAGYPMLMQIGYQFEVQYLGEGDFSALFEFIPMISGLDQSMVIPTLTIMNGLRNSIHGWEIAIGPTFTLTKMTDVYIKDGTQYLKSEYNGDEPQIFKNLEDSRGAYTLRSMVVVAVGKTFKSGKMNIPINLFVIPATDGLRAGISFGYNAKKNK